MSVALALTRRQRFLAECWYNLVHEASLDAFRVRTMNPGNAVRELRRVCDEAETEAYREQVAKEAYSILTTDQIVQESPVFQPVASDLAALLKNISPKILEGNTGQVAFVWRLVATFARELDELLQRDYVQRAINCLRDYVWAPDGATIAADERDLVRIGNILGALLSTLVDRGWNLESLFGLHRRDLGNWEPKSGALYNFDNAFRRTLERIELQPQEYTVTFVLTSVSKPAEFPSPIAGITFTPTPPELLPDTKTMVTRFAAAGGGKIFATATVPAQEARMAGAVVRERIARVLDVMRYSYERKEIQLSQKFIVSTPGRRTHGLIDLAGESIPNPRASISAVQFTRFIEQIQQLADGGSVEADARDRIYSAFRLYRLGSETTNLENKLVNWWTALEFLTNDVDSSNIGKTVETALAPVVTLEYLPKHLHALRLVLIDLGAQLTDPDTRNDVTLSELSLAQLYVLLKKPQVRDAVLVAAVDHPYIWSSAKELLDDLSSPVELSKTLNRHAERLKWHIRRIYQARNDVVHSARRISSARLLCANLEVYLKHALDGFLEELQLKPTLRGAGEYFDRRNHLLDKITGELKTGNETTLLSWLAHFDGSYA